MWNVHNIYCLIAVGHSAGEMGGSGNHCDVSSLKVGDFMSRVNYMRVTSIDGDYVSVEDENGFSWRIGRSIVGAQCDSSDQFTKEERVTLTEAARILEQDVRDCVFSCEFTKAPDIKDQDQMMQNADLGTQAKRRRVIKEMCTGKERIMHGHILDTHEIGRMPVYDLEAKGERRVDLRTLKWIVFKGTKYSVK